MDQEPRRRHAAGNSSKLKLGVVRRELGGVELDAGAHGGRDRHRAHVLALGTRRLGLDDRVEEKNLNRILNSTQADADSNVLKVESMQKAMEQQPSADRFKQATILEAEGRREAMIREADGKLEAAKREAEAQIRLAEASAAAIKDISAAIQDRDLPAVFLLGDRYVNMMQKLAGSQNAKMVVLPADLPAALRGLMGKG